MSTSMRSPAANGADPSTRTAEDEDLLAKALGYASIGLGIPLSTMPGRTLQAIGVEPGLRSRAIALAVAAQEYTAALGILALERPRPVKTVWSRVAGDVWHLSLLASAWRSKRVSAPRLAGATAFVVGCGVVDTLEALRLSREAEGTTKQEATSMQVKTSITVRAPRE